MEKALHVFRIRCEHLPQADLFVENRAPQEVIFDAFEEHPVAQIGGGSEWHIAGTDKFSSAAIAFQIGRIQSVNTPKYDDAKQFFYDSEGERAPYVYGVFDGQTQACVIEKKSPISAKAEEVALKLEKLLNSVPFAADAGFRIVVDELRDPEGFIEQVKGAYKVTRFQFVAEFENPHDVQALIHGPAERYNKAIGGSRTTIETRGPDLDKELVEEVARSAASLGDTASATILEESDTKPKTIYLRGTPLLERIQFSEGIDEMKEKMLMALRSAYGRLRSVNND
ncbi:hypothetical protein [Novosphingobium sp. PP1Y]|uniref:hypothetical protein n=1 Tax=Novosphingobium sp. PP1Y TaxID=702113 RepID=UPI00020EECDB|nr:hypothetical protein [Novosphingobium sp. PP1Y]CCA92626.1 conserved hypothetical protein [Novosphingobium sp. PP1Y]